MNVLQPHFRIDFLELFKTVTGKLWNSSCPIYLLCFCIIVIHNLPCLFGSDPISFLTSPEGLLSLFTLGYIKHYTDNSSHISRTVLVGGFMEKKISLYAVGTEHLGFVIVTSPFFKKAPIMLVIYLCKLLWYSLLELSKRAPYNFSFGKPHNLPGKTLVTVYVYFIQVSLKHRAWNAVKQGLQKPHIILELILSFPEFSYIKQYSDHIPCVFFFVQKSYPARQEVSFYAVSTHDFFFRYVASPFLQQLQIVFMDFK